jgi:DUF4097 and DUF4098 domain-containing protein YvlB
MRSTFFISVLVFLFAINSIAQDGKYSFKENYNVSSSPKLEISTSDGDIKVKPGSDGNIEVYYIVYKGNNFLNISKEELEEHVTISITHNDNLLSISVKNKNNLNWNWNNYYDVSFQIITPASTSCYLKSSDGDIYLSGLNADQKCRTSDGDISAKKINGNVEMITSDGDITARGIYGDMNLETSDGDVLVEGVEGVATIITSDGDITIDAAVGAINAVTSDGDIIATNCAGSVIASTSDGDVSVDFVKVIGRISLVTSDGDISVSIPEGLGMDIKLKGETLRTPKMNFTGKMDKYHIEGQVDGGGIPVDLITSDGTVELSYR